jgi:hypothetical protein
VDAELRANPPDPLGTRAESRIAGAVDDEALQLLRGNHHPLALPQFDAGAVSADLQMQSLVLVLAPSASQQAAVETLIEAQRNPASPYFHQWLTPEQFAEHFGASAEDVQRISAWLESQGFHIDEVAPSRRTITFSGSASQVERAFATKMRQYRVNGALHIANATDPSIPAALAPIVTGVLSLHDFRLQATHSAIRAPVAQMSMGNTYFVTPGDLATIYNATPLYTQGIDGSGQAVAVVARSNIKVADVHTFRANFGLPVNDPQVILNGTDPGTADAAELIEATLDAEYAGALAPKSTVKFVATASTATSDGTYLSAQYIVNQNLAPVMTMSFGLCEADLGTSGNAYMNSLWQQAAAQGITVLVSAGDSGAAGCDSASASVAQAGLAVNGICSTPYDLCVGGTEFNDTGNPALYWSTANTSSNASALGYIPEAVWNESTSGLWAGGGGRSNLYTKPAWQAGTGVPADGKRDVPDLSLSAAGHDGYIIIMNGQEFVVGGTSASTPVLAGVFALLAQSTGARLGLPNTRLYALSNATPSAFHDITSGNNSVPGLTGFSTTLGYDLASGLGSVNASTLVAHWRDNQSSPAIQLTVSQNSLSAVSSASASTSVQIGVSGGFNAAVVLTASGLPSGITAVFSPAKVSAPGSGSSTLQLAVASTVAAGNYTFNVVASSGTTSASAPVAVSVVAPTFTLAASSASATLLPSASSSITITSAGNSGLNSSVALKITGLPAGVTGSFSPSSIAAPGSGKSVLTLYSTSSIVRGSYSVVVTGTAGTLSKTVQFTLNLPSLSVVCNSGSLSLARGATATVTLTTNIAGGFNSPVTVALSGLSSGVTALLSPASLAAPGAGTVSVNLTASTTATLGAAKVTITTSGGGLAATVPLALTVVPQPTFSFTAVSATTVKITAGGSATVQFASAAQNGFASPITLSATGAAAGTTLKLSTAAISPGQGSSLTIGTTNLAAGSSTITVTATGGGQTHSVTVALTVVAVPHTNVAVPHNGLLL